MKPKLIKLTRTDWRWSCSDPIHGGIVGATFRRSQHRDPWCAAIADACAHHARYHAEQKNTEALTAFGWEEVAA